MIVDPATASIATGVPVRTIRRWVFQGRMVDHGDGLRILVDIDEVAQLQDIRATRKDGRLPKTGAMA